MNSGVWVLDPAVSAAATVLVTLVVLRLLVPHALHLLARSPGQLGHAAGRLVFALRPGILRRLIALVLGLGIPATTASALTSPAMAASIPASRVSAAHTTAAVTAAPHIAPTTSAPAQPAIYTVRPGDTLWDIARRHLDGRPSDAAIARAWPRWYAANRALIGSDPNLILPGMRLLIPGTRATGTSAPSHHRPASLDASSLDPDRR